MGHYGARLRTIPLAVLGLSLCLVGEVSALPIVIDSTTWGPLHGGQGILNDDRFANAATHDSREVAKLSPSTTIGALMGLDVSIASQSTSFSGVLTASIVELDDGALPVDSAAPRLSSKRP